MKAGAKSYTVPPTSVERANSALNQRDLNDLCDATDLAVQAGGGFGWVELPAREVLERYWQGVMAMPLRQLFLARLEKTICGTAQLIFAPNNNQAQMHAAQVSGMFVAPWARGHGLGTLLLREVENAAWQEGIEVLNLDVRESQHSAIKLYKTTGYHIWGTNPHYAKIDGKYVSGLYFSKVIAPANTTATAE